MEDLKETLRSWRHTTPLSLHKSSVKSEIDLNSAWFLSHKCPFCDKENKDNNFKKVNNELYQNVCNRCNEKELHSKIN